MLRFENDVVRQRASATMRRAAKVDDNHAEIVAILRCFGMSVQSLAATGKGCPDLLVGYRGRTHLVEVKDGSKSPSRRTLTPDQEAWQAAWRGSEVVLLDSALAARTWALAITRVS
jgi:hypothetical protein